MLRFGGTYKKEEDQRRRRKEQLEVKNKIKKKILFNEKICRSSERINKNKIKLKIKITHLSIKHNK